MKKTIMTLAVLCCSMTVLTACGNKDIASSDQRTLPVLGYSTFH